MIRWIDIDRITQPIVASKQQDAIASFYGRNLGAHVASRESCRLHADPTNCTPYSSTYFTLPKSNPNYHAYYATLLAAYMAKESVKLRPVDSSTGCVISYIEVP